MSSLESGERRTTATDAIAGLMAAGSIALGALAIAERPARLAPVAIVLALVASRMSPRFERLGLLAALVAMLGFVLGMTFAVITEAPLF